jgi:hypothetical protein
MSLSKQLMNLFEPAMNREEKRERDAFEALKNVSI